MIITERPQKIAIPINHELFCERPVIAGLEYCSLTSSVKVGDRVGKPGEFIILSEDGIEIITGEQLRKRYTNVSISEQQILKNYNRRHACFESLKKAAKEAGGGVSDDVLNMTVRELLDFIGPNNIEFVWKGQT